MSVVTVSQQIYNKLNDQVKKEHLKELVLDVMNKRSLLRASLTCGSFNRHFDAFQFHAEIEKKSFRPIEDFENKYKIITKQFLSSCIRNDNLLLEDKLALANHITSSSDHLFLLDKYCPSKLETSSSCEALVTYFLKSEEPPSITEQVVKKITGICKHYKYNC